VRCCISDRCHYFAPTSDGCSSGNGYARRHPALKLMPSSDLTFPAVPKHVFTLNLILNCYRRDMRINFEQVAMSLIFIIILPLGSPALCLPILLFASQPPKPSILQTCKSEIPV
jgi:hypothetical protein